MKKHKLPGTVIALGLVSFMNDLASEMVTPFIPIQTLVVVAGMANGMLGISILEVTSHHSPGAPYAAY